MILSVINKVNNMEVKITKQQSAHDLPLPKYATSESAGMDLMANIIEPIILAKGERKLIPTGLAIQLPTGYEAQIRPRSGLALKNGVTVLNTPGTIDADYRGELMVILINLSDQDFKIERGMRIAQMIIAPFTQAKLILVESLEDSERGVGGFGSTGVK
jgi:dUTP pyrophosphatase